MNFKSLNARLKRIDKRYEASIETAKFDKETALKIYDKARVDKDYKAGVSEAKKVRMVARRGARKDFVTNEKNLWRYEACKRVLKATKESYFNYSKIDTEERAWFKNKDFFRLCEQYDRFVQRFEQIAKQLHFTPRSLERRIAKANKALEVKFGKDENLIF